MLIRWHGEQALSNDNDGVEALVELIKYLLLVSKVQRN